MYTRGASLHNFIQFQTTCIYVAIYIPVHTFLTRIRCSSAGSHFGWSALTSYPGYILTGSIIHGVHQNCSIFHCTNIYKLRINIRYSGSSVPLLHLILFGIHLFCKCIIGPVNILWKNALNCNILMFRELMVKWCNIYAPFFSLIVFTTSIKTQLSILISIYIAHLYTRAYTKTNIT